MLRLSAATAPMRPEAVATSAGGSAPTDGPTAATRRVDGIWGATSGGACGFIAGTLGSANGVSAWVGGAKVAKPGVSGAGALPEPAAVRDRARVSLGRGLGRALVGGLGDGAGAECVGDGVGDGVAGLPPPRMAHRSAPSLQPPSVSGVLAEAGPARAMRAVSAAAATAADAAPAPHHSRFTVSSLLCLSPGEMALRVIRANSRPRPPAGRCVECRKPRDPIELA